MARRRRKHRKNPKAKRRHRRARRAGRKMRRRSPLRRHKRRRMRRNPGEGIFAREATLAAPTAAPKRKRRRLSKAARRRRATSRRLLGQVRSLRKRAVSAPKKSLRRSVLTTQAHRLSTLRRAALKGHRLSKSPVAKAMHTRSNPGVAGIIASAKVLAPHIGVGAVSLVGCAMGGHKVALMIVSDAAGNVKPSFLDAAGAPKAFVPYIAPLSTAAIAVAGYALANKVAPKFKGAILIGGMLGAVVQAIVSAANVKADPTSLIGKATAALGLGDYTTIGGRSYAEGGMFREVGDYTTIGSGAYSTQRPRQSADNSTEWAASGLGSGAYSNARPRLSADNQTEWATNGLDDTTEFAPGEGGVLSGGIFRGSSR